MAAFDTLTYARKLQEAGLSEELATVHAEAMRDVLDAQRSEIATKSDLTALEGRLTTQMAQMETRLMRWMLAAAALGGLFGGFIAAVAKFF